MDFAEELVRRHLISAANELLALAGHPGAHPDPESNPASINGGSPAAGAPAGLSPEPSKASLEPLNGKKERVRSLLQRMEGCLRGARSLLPEFPHRQPHGEPLTVVGQVRCLALHGPAMLLCKHCIEEGASQPSRLAPLVRARYQFHCWDGAT